MNISRRAGDLRWRIPDHDQMITIAVINMRDSDLILHESCDRMHPGNFDTLYVPALRGVAVVICRVRSSLSRESSSS